MKAKCWIITFLCLVLVSFAALEVYPRPCRPGLIPNGTKFSCSNCHFNSAGGGPRNPFGLQVQDRVTTGSCDPFWANDLAILEADGDGFSNGLELQDPDGLWNPGEPQPGDFDLVSNPGDAASTPSLPSSSVPQPGMTITLELIVDELVAPTVLTHAGDDSGRIFLVDQPGQIYIIQDGAPLPTPFLDVSSKMVTLNPGFDERGLLGLAFHPDYETNGRFFVYYSAPPTTDTFNNNSVLAEYTVSAADPNVADSASEQIILEVDEPEFNHNAGSLVFGDDGFLYVALGDGGGAGDDHGIIGNGQDLNTLLGSILRIDVDSASPYAVPPDNPFVGVEGLDEIWAYGLRNPWKISFDRETGRLFCADLGQNIYEEVDIIKKGRNYGWRVMEGFHCFDPPSGCDTSGLELPIIEYDHSIGTSVIGGFVYRGGRYPALQGKYVFGDWREPDALGRLMYLDEVSTGSWELFDFVIDGGGQFPAYVRGFGEDADGELYVLSSKEFGPTGTTGAVHRIRVPMPTPTPTKEYAFEPCPENWTFSPVLPTEIHISHWDNSTSLCTATAIGISTPFDDSTNYFSLWDSLDDTPVPYVADSLYRADWFFTTNRMTTDAVPSTRFRMGLTNQKAFSYSRIYPGNWLPLSPAPQLTTYTIFFEPPLAAPGLFLAFSTIDWTDDFRGTSPAGEVLLEELTVYRHELASFTNWLPQTIASTFDQWTTAGAPPYTVATASRTPEGLSLSSGVNADRVFGVWDSPSSLFSVGPWDLYRLSLTLSCTPHLGGPDLRLRVQSDDFRYAWYVFYVSSFTEGESAIPREEGTTYHHYLMLPFSTQPCNLSFDLIDFSNVFGGTLSLQNVSLDAHPY